MKHIKQDYSKLTHRGAEQRERCVVSGKIRFGKNRKAQNSINFLIHKLAREVTLRSYQCEHCGGWHLTKKKLD